MYPLDNVVANVHGIGALGEHFNPKRILETGGFKRLIPPACTLNQRAANWFRRAAIDVIHDRLDRLANRRCGILLLQAMSRDDSQVQRLA